MTNKVIKPNPYGPVLTSLLDELRRSYARDIPKSYVSYLSENNGGEFENSNFMFDGEVDGENLHHMFGLHFGPNHLRLQDNHELSKSYDLEDFGSQLENYLVIASTSTGDPVMIDLDNGEVVCFAADEMAGDSYEDFKRAVKKISKNFDEFVSGLMNLEEVKSRVLDEDQRMEFEKRLADLKRQREESDP